MPGSVPKTEGSPRPGRCRRTGRRHPVTLAYMSEDAICVVDLHAPGASKSRLDLRNQGRDHG